MKHFFSYKLCCLALAIVVGCLTAQKATAQDSFGGEMLGVSSSPGSSDVSWVTIGIGAGQVSQQTCSGCPIYTNDGTFLGYSTNTYQEGAAANADNATTYAAGDGITVSYNDGQVTITWPDGSSITTTGSSYSADGSSGICNGCSQPATAADYAVGAQQAVGTPMSSQIPTATNAMYAAANIGDWQTYEYYYYYLYYMANGSTLNGNASSAPPPPPPPPPVEALTKTIPPCNGLTFISPEGTPITLPPGSTIGTISLDPGVFTNGALYSFYTANGTEYMERETNNYSNSSGASPTYMGYYPVITNGSGQRSWGPGPAFPFTYTPIPANGVVAATLLSVDANCNLDQTPINYTVTGADPSAIGTGGSLPQNDDVEDAPASGSPCASTPITTPGACSFGSDENNPAADRAKLSNYLSNASTSESLTVFVNVFAKNSVKFYFKDCQTGNVTSTWDGAGQHVLTGAAQTTATNTFNNGTFASTDASIAVEASVCSGKWNFNVKYNPNSLNPDPKIAPVLAQVESTIQAEAADEVKKLTVPGETEPAQTYNLPDGETFSKASFDLLEAVAAIYDVGEDIINTGQLPTKLWDRGTRANNVTIPAQAEAHGKSPFKIPDLMGGASDQLIFEATGAVQLVKTGLEIMRHPIQSATGIWNSISSLTFSKVEQMASDMSGASNYAAGGDLAWYQGGKNGVQVAMILFSGALGDVTNGANAITESGEAVTGIESFIPTGSTGSNAATVIENATANSEKLLDLEGQNMLTTNVTSTEVKEMEVVTEGGAEYTEPIVNDVVDNVGQNVLDVASPEDMTAAAGDNGVYTQMTQQPQQFIDGKAFEKVVDNDVNHATEVATESGINLTNYQQAGQVQIQLPNGTWCVADNVWYEPTSNPKVFNVVINETKLSTSAPFSTNQGTLIGELTGTPPNTSFTLKSAKFGQTFPQGSTLNVQSMVKTVGNGTPTGGYKVDKIF